MWGRWASKVSFSIMGEEDDEVARGTRREMWDAAGRRNEGKFLAGMRDLLTGKVRGREEEEEGGDGEMESFGALSNIAAEARGK